MKNLIMILVSLTSTAAFADGFICQTVEGDLNVKVYNHTSPDAGTRNGSVMVISDPSIGSGRKTIAKFTDVKGTLSNSGASYVADVDLRYSDSNRAGELIAGTKLGYLNTIELEIDFSYSAPLAADETVAGRLVLTKRNGAEIVRDMDCSRYLKN